MFRNLFWFDEQGKRYETDIIAVAVNRLFIFEAKGALLPDRIRTGNFAKAKSFLKDTHGFAGTQAGRLAHEIKRRSDGLPMFTEDGHKIITLTADMAEEVIAFSLTIDQLGTIANARQLLETVGILDDKAFRVPPLMVSEFEKVLEALPDEIYRLHYLTRRHQLYGAVDIIGDELDVFATYVMRGFSSLPPQGYNSISALGASYYLDNFIQGGHVVFPPGSSLANTRYFDRVLRYMVERKPDRYLDLAFSVLDIPADIQQRFEEMMKELRAAAQKLDSDQIQVGSVPVKRGLMSLVVAGSVYGDMDREVRNDALTRGLADAIVNRGVQSGFLIGRELGFEQYPYSVSLFLRMKPSEASSKS